MHNLLTLKLVGLKKISNDVNSEAVKEALSCWLFITDTTAVPRKEE